MLRNPRVANEISFVAAVCSLCVFANSSVGARPAKNPSPVVPPPKQAPVRTDLTPRDKNECLAVAQALNEQASRLSQRTRHGVPREFTRVASDLDQSCRKEDFNKAWISIEWINGCLDNFTKGPSWDSALGTKATLAHSIQDQTLVRGDGDRSTKTPDADACIVGGLTGNLPLASRYFHGPASRLISFCHGRKCLQ
jgi:hypothetical protein